MGPRPMKNAIGADLAPQRPRYAREKAEPSGHILEPEWKGVRALVRVGHNGPRFIGYDGPVDGPRELYEAIVADTRSNTATIDGVNCDILSTGNAIGQVTGMMQASVRVPAGVRSGTALPIVISLGGVPSQAGVVVAVQ